MLGAQLPLLSALPFVLLLLAIALAPLAVPRWWHANPNKALVAFIITIPVLLQLFGLGEAGRQLLAEKAYEYVGFIVVIGALFAVSGGIHIEGSLSGTPMVNTAVLGIGAVLANLVGTTGASVLLIRPLLRANKRRQRVAHTVIFNFWDQWAINKEEQERRGSLLEEVMEHAPLRIRGGVEMLVLLGVLLTIISAGRASAAGRPWQGGMQELVIVFLALIGYFAGSHEHRTKNLFTFSPFIEVAILFAAIFITMAPVLEILNAWSQGANAMLTMPWHFFWASGTLSSVLDNAPTYLAFAASAAGLQHLPPHGPFIGALALDPAGARLSAALSTGSVFMGANTYIGNAPNFMVKAIAEEHGVKMPSFFGYMAYSVGILLPLFVVVSLVFFT